MPVNISSRNARGRANSLTGARRARGARGARRSLDDGDDHQESVMGGRASAPVENVGNVRGAPPTVLGVPIRATENRATTAMKAFLQLRLPTFKGESNPLVAEDWLEQVTRALDTILVTEKELRVLFASYQLQGLSRFVKVFVPTEEEKAKQFMRGLRPSIRNKIARNLIKVYSTMVSSVAANEETLNKTRKIQNPKSQCERTSNQSERRSFKKPKNSTAQQQYHTRSLPATFVVSSGQTYRGGSICFGCHQLGHRVMDCSLKEGEQSGSYRIATTYSGQRMHGWVYAMTSAAGPSGTVGQQEQQLDTSVVRGTLLMFNSRARVLINTGASHSFIASSFALALGFKVEVLDSVLMLDTPVGGRTTLRRVYKSCEIEIGDKCFVFDFIVLDMTSFDVIIGMDWLTDYWATIDCVRHQVTFCTLRGDRFHFMGDRGCDFVPLSIDVSRQEELNFSFLGLFGRRR
ncbi:hypothetical protein Acr_00g0093390 [Actinidia rufa]|uniref:CCHC-type domain-containing protein n=1 Tax=Actinidia rufa TaxID=165716 RepID=A0A7J0DXU2_9ERIC|nr:hypothetical protein Acr_00g0093390 [Actinidia rufa]